MISFQKFPCRFSNKAGNTFEFHFSYIFKIGFRLLREPCGHRDVLGYFGDLPRVHDHSNPLGSTRPTQHQHRASLWKRWLV